MSYITWPYQIADHNCRITWVYNNMHILFIYYRSPNFHLPKELDCPLILVGPGTGIAPFRSFWQHIDNHKQIGTDAVNGFH